MHIYMSTYMYTNIYIYIHTYIYTYSQHQGCCLTSTWNPLMLLTVSQGFCQPSRKDSMDLANSLGWTGRQAQRGWCEGRCSGPFSWWCLSCTEDAMQTLGDGDDAPEQLNFALHKKTKLLRCLWCLNKLKWRHLPQPRSSSQTTKQ